MTTKTETKTPRTFDETRRLAGHLGEKLKIIQDKMPYSEHIHGKAADLLAISTQ